MEQVNVNDGGGLFDNIGLIDTLIVDCNELPKLLISGQGVGWCAKVVEMTQKLVNLKKGVRADVDSMRRQIETLVHENESLTAQLMQQKGES